MWYAPSCQASTLCSPPPPSTAGSERISAADLQAGSTASRTPTGASNSS